MKRPRPVGLTGLMNPSRSYRDALVRVFGGVQFYRWSCPVVLFVMAVLSRIPFTSGLLYDQDSVQFALALEKYDVYLHQPHPPGYFLYVMIGKAINLFLENPNASLILLSVVASGLTVVVIYHLATMIFDRETGLWAALLALTSPLLWYYGEVALAYIVGAFLTTWLASLCWNLLQKGDKWLYISPVLLGIIGGIRQDLFIFMLPLWLLCLIKLPWVQLLVAGLILGATVASWFVPMLAMTGGPERYFLAIREYWFFHTSTFAVWNAGLGSRLHFFLAFLGNTFYGTGLGGIFILLTGYLLVRTGEWRRLSTEKVLFFSVCLVPAFLFNMLIFMNPDQAGYSVFFLPALLILLWPSINYVLAEIGKVLGRRFFSAKAAGRATALVLIAGNTLFFLVSNSVVSAKGIREHDNNLSAILRGIEQNFPPDETVIIDEKFYGLYNYRHVQYYLRPYRVYLTALSANKDKPWHIFGGHNGQTFITSRIDIPPAGRYVVYLTNPLDQRYADELQSKQFHRLLLDDKNGLFYKKIDEGRQDVREPS